MAGNRFAVLFALALSAPALTLYAALALPASAIAQPRKVTVLDRIVAFVASVMKPVLEPGKVAGWIAPPDRGINSLPVDYEYVKV